MLFSNVLHKQRFIEEVKRLYFPDRKILAVIFLLTSNTKIWELSKDKIENESIDFDSIKVRNASLDTYTIYKAAKQFYQDDNQFTIQELINRLCTSDSVFKLIIQATIIARNGIPNRYYGGEESVKSNSIK